MMTTPMPASDLTGPIGPVPTPRSTALRSGWRRAFRADVRLHADVLLGEALLGVLALVVGWLGATDLALLAPIWAVLAWYRYGRGDTAERVLLLTSLGISRADRVRGRAALVGLDAAVLAGVWLAARVMALTLGAREGMTAFMHEHPVIELVDDALTLVLVLLLVALMVGRACLLHRPGTGMGPLSLATGLGAWVLSVVAEQALTGWVTGPGPDGTPRGASGLQLWMIPLPLVVLVGGAALLLAGRLRTWIRALDEGGAAARE